MGIADILRRTGVVAPVHEGFFLARYYAELPHEAVLGLMFLFCSFLRVCLPHTGVANRVSNMGTICDSTLGICSVFFR